MATCALPVLPTSIHGLNILSASMCSRFSIVQNGIMTSWSFFLKEIICDKKVYYWILSVKEEENAETWQAGKFAYHHGKINKRTLAQLKLYDFGK